MEEGHNDNYNKRCYNAANTTEQLHEDSIDDDFDCDSNTVNVHSSLITHGSATTGIPYYDNSLDGALNEIGIGYFHYIAIAILGLGNAADAAEVLSMGYILTVFPSNDDVDLVTKGEKGILTASVFAGMLVGGLLCGIVSDRIGRKPCLVACLSINAIFGLLSAATSSLTWLVIVRVCAGIGIGGSVPSVFTMCAEYLPKAKRGYYLTIVAWFWMVGSVYTGGMAWLILGHYKVSWRYFAIICALPSILSAFLVSFILPETPHWLFLRGKSKEASEILCLIASRSGKTYLTFSSNNPVADGRFDIKVDQRQSISKLLHRSQLRSLLLLMLIWFMLSFGSYGLLTWIPILFSDIGLNLNIYQDAFLVAGATLPGNIVSALLMDRIGRKFVLAGGMTLACLAAIAFSFYLSTPPAVTVLTACLFNAFSVAGWNSLDCLSAESFPTSVRTTAMGLLAAAGRLGSIIAQVVNSNLISQNDAVILIVTGSAMLMGAVTTIFLPKEPAKRALDERVD